MIDCNSNQSGAYPPPPPCKSMEFKVFLPAVYTQTEYAHICVDQWENCENLPLRTYADNIPVYVTKDEGFLTQIFSGQAILVDNGLHEVVDWGSVCDLVYLSNDHEATLFISLWMDGQWYFLALRDTGERLL